MGHRHLYSSSPMFEGEPDQNWNHMHMDQQYVNLGRSSTSDNGSFIYPSENMSIDNISFPSHWNTAPRSNGYASTSLNIEAPPHQTDVSGTSHDHFLPSPSAGMFYAMPENYVHQPSNSNYDRQAFSAADGVFNDLTMGNGRGPQKRKSPGIPPVCERGSTSRYFNAASAADRPTSSELWPEKPNMDSLYMPWDHVNMTPTFRGRGLSIRGEGPLRNVRSRSALDLESNLARAHLSNTHPHNSYSTGLPVDHSSSVVDLSTQTSGTLTRDWSPMSSCPPHGRVSSSDANAFNHEASHFLNGSGSSNAPVDVGGFHNEFGTSRNPTAPQSFRNNLTQTARGVRSNYSQRSTPTFRASSSLHLGRVIPSDDGLHMVAESYSSRHPRPLTTVGWQSNDRHGRSRIPSDRYRSLADEGFMIVDRTSLNGSRNMLDQHRDMRMDIDNMSYEELLALGERIGHVSTGLSEDLISKYLTETIYCSSEQSQEEETCAICLVCFLLPFRIHNIQ
ncbi:E3 ubiquitin-protein ligase MBR2 isoform E [Glycine soja]|uniref:RING-type E3 ubiquitin transferase n=1 Tax=Glycine soja TaxID=3848 RepID=A0A445HFW9_GLYSO|nr:E3 ubiquitin-protein ligase MBR2 isoform E [Glycine soja]